MASPLPYEPTPEEVVEHAQRHRQVIVTQNHDMMTLCEELGQRFIWIDPRSRQLHREQQVLLVFSQIRAWDEILAVSPQLCVRSMRTKCVGIEPAEAARLARQRMRSLLAGTRSRSRRTTPLGELTQAEPDG